MPTFYDPVADASEAAEALRGLAHASRDFAHPEDAYGVIGDLLGGVRSLQQSIEQIAARHARHEGRAFDDAGNQAVGIRDARTAAEQLAAAAATLGQVEDQLNTASQTAGRIAWHPAIPSPLDNEAVGTDPAGAETAEVDAPAIRWVNVVFLQGGDADAVLWLIDRDGPDAAIDHLRGYDYGSESTDAAMEHGYVYDNPPVHALDKEAVSGAYTMIYNPDLGHVALYRQHPIPPEDRLPAEPPAPTPTAPSRAAVAGGGPARGPAVSGAGAAARAGKRAPAPGGWFAHPGVAAVKRDRGLGL
ncbi:hypothetical protein [Brevibacterium luteolum]|uniref:hypothetical protein n=1 Tax=Brevibacterium luteolum TaxID=199591 RepID=UPI001C2208E0|nr:hypothetical protein [Brevibacterium luteolum]MBU8577600.1 hypothetical protein [Brevibacterium luteolum]